MRLVSSIEAANTALLVAARDAKAARAAEGDAARRHHAGQLPLSALLAAVRASALADARVDHLSKSLATLKESKL